MVFWKIFFWKNLANIGFWGFYKKCIWAKNSKICQKLRSPKFPKNVDLGLIWHSKHVYTTKLTLIHCFWGILENLIFDQKFMFFDPLKIGKFYIHPPHTFYRFNFFGSKLTKVFHSNMEGTVFFISPYLFFSRRRGHLNFEIFAKNGPKIDFLGHPTPKLVARSILTANLDSPSKISPNRALRAKSKFFFDK